MPHYNNLPTPPHKYHMVVSAFATPLNLGTIDVQKNTTANWKKAKTSSLTLQYLTVVPDDND